MKFRSAQFIIDESDDVFFAVNFHSRRVSVTRVFRGRDTPANETRREFPNESGAYKPCVTHCRELIRLANDEDATTAFERKRRAYSEKGSA